MEYLESSNIHFRQDETHRSIKVALLQEEKKKSQTKEKKKAYKALDKVQKFSGRINNWWYFITTP
jgi:hypothetical protein